MKGPTIVAGGGANDKDGWFIGFSSGLTTGVWMGRDDAKPVGENRFRLGRDWESVLKYYRTTYSARYTRRPIADQPGVKAVHIANPDAKPGQWEGLNVYELKGEVRIFVLVKQKPQHP